MRVHDRAKAQREHTQVCQGLHKETMGALSIRQCSTMGCRSMREPATFRGQGGATKLEPVELTEQRSR